MARSQRCNASFKYLEYHMRSNNQFTILNNAVGESEIDNEKKNAIK